jgi:hypothetical protein
VRVASHSDPLVCPGFVRSHCPASWHSACLQVAQVWEPSNARDRLNDRSPGHPGCWIAQQLDDSTRVSRGIQGGTPARNPLVGPPAHRRGTRGENRSPRGFSPRRWGSKGGKDPLPRFHLSPTFQHRFWADAARLEAGRRRQDSSEEGRLPGMKSRRHLTARQGSTARPPAGDTHPDFIQADPLWNT